MKHKEIWLNDVPTIWLMKDILAPKHHKLFNEPIFFNLASILDAVEFNQLFEEPKNISFHLSYKPHKHGIIITMKSPAILPFKCQVCYKIQDQCYEINSVFHVCRSKKNVSDTPNKIEEWFQLNEAYTLIDLLRDEIILSINQFPRHSNCNILQSKPLPNPFAILKDKF